ncbi:MAG: hypothetical protein M1825_005232 [Sarcosagium campestre]|nr:MAG: hypothetical protein M1825_005232 [Sarcosagium campestre]
MAKDIFTHNFTFPSLYDGLELECRLQLHRQHKNGQSKGAVFAHPYAPLGGTFDDGVVKTVTRELLNQGYIVTTFNFRGAGRSKGKTSWTGSAERADYMSVVCFLVFYLQSSELISTAPQQAKDNAVEEQPPMLLLGGYSYGSLITTRLPSMTEIISSCYEDNKSSMRVEIQRIAREAASKDCLIRNEGTLGDHRRLSPPTLRVLLVSPLLPPVSSLAVCFSGFGPGSSAKLDLAEHDTLAIYGDADVFTSQAKLQKWASKLHEQEASRFSFKEVKNAGHFWVEEGASEQLRRAVRDWLETNLL